MMAPSLSGIDTWISSIRNRMENDPGRQDLEDHILCNGFLFLQEYLEDILSGTKSEPIIELTKTPGRRKAISRKDRLESATKAKRFLESPEKENIDIFSLKPMPSFQALVEHERVVELGFSKIVKPGSLSQNSLNIKRQNFQSNPEEQDDFQALVEHERVVESGFSKIIKSGSLSQNSPNVKRQNFQSNAEEQDELAVEILVTPPPTSSNIPSLEASISAVRTVKFSVESETNEDISKPSGALSMIAEGDEQETSQPAVSPRKVLIIGEREISYQIPRDPDDPDGPMATITVPYSEDDRSFDDSEPTSTISSFPIDPYARDYETHELPKIVPIASPRMEEKPPIQVSAPNLVRKASVPVFPILPPPSPMRKSARDSADIPNGVGVKPTYNGGRTSWLQKARDVTAKHNGVKRKSDEMVEDHVKDGLDKPFKAARIEDNDTEQFSADKVQPKPVIQPFRPIAKPRDPPPPQVQHARVQAPPHEYTDGMMDVLKRTVEGLGARAGKGLGKSLGGAAASAAAAEAKAAAEARLAQREAKGSDGAGPRPSVSELVDVFESGSTNNGNSRRSRSNPPTSTSPIAPRLLLDRDSAANAQLDSPPNAPIRIVSQNTIPRFQVQRPPLKEFNNSQSQSQGHSQPSTQSTYVSSLFDDNPTWTHSSFATELTTTQTFSQNQSQGSQSQGVSQRLEDDVIHSENIGRSQEHDQSRTHERSIVDVHTGTLDEEEMILGQDVVPHLPDSQPVELNDNQAEDAVLQPNKNKPQGFVAQATSMISKVMGSATSKRVKPEPVKSIQLAAVAAKKQQEEAEKKAARLRDMEKRRAIIASKKAEQDADKTKLSKREREDDTTKILLKKSDDDTMKKRKVVVVEIEKKSVNVKKPLSKGKISSVSVNTGTVRTLAKTTPSAQTPLLSTGTAKGTKQTTSTLNSGQCQLEFKTPMLASSSKLQASHSKPNLKEAAYEDMRQPSEALQAQMHARIQAQMVQVKQQENQEPLVPSESIELPDINSEYSDSDEEDRPRTFDPPDWAQSPVLAQALQSQSRLNPDDIFGPVRPLRMDEIFKKNTSRFRARTSSANWVGADELTKEEEKAYAKRMGYVKF